MRLVQNLQETKIPKPTCRNEDQVVMRNRAEVAWKIWAFPFQRVVVI